MKRYWLFKTEPSSYSIDDLKKDKKTEWNGIRNYQVRNLIRDTMQIGDEVLLYHSSTKEIGVVGRAKIVSESYPDTEQWKVKSKYFDTGSKRENPRWFSRNIAFVEKFKRVVTLGELKQEKALASLVILRPGNRLSITPLTEGEYRAIESLAGKKGQ